MKRTIYVKRSFERPGIEFTSNKREAMDFVHKRLAAPTLAAAAELKPEHQWDLIPVEQTGGTVYVVTGDHDSYCSGICSLIVA